MSWFERDFLFGDIGCFLVNKIFDVFFGDVKIVVVVEDRF